MHSPINHHRKWVIPAAAVVLIVFALLIVPALIDINSYRSQFASQRVIFGGPGKNCFTRRRTSSR